ncbi:hypothetical protein OAO87_03590 [bacterium]|nr:hypothetical protein [bacterium]
MLQPCEEVQDGAAILGDGDGANGLALTLAVHCEDAVALKGGKLLLQRLGDLNIYMGGMRRRSDAESTSAGSTSSSVGGPSSS